MDSPRFPEKAAESERPREAALCGEAPPRKRAAADSDAESQMAIEEERPLGADALAALRERRAAEFLAKAIGGEVARSAISEAALRQCADLDDDFLIQSGAIDRATLAVLREPTRLDKSIGPLLVGFTTVRLYETRAAFDIARMPLMSASFAAPSAPPIKSEKARKAAIRSTSRDGPPPNAKQRKAEFSIIATPRMKHRENVRLTIPREQYFRTFDAIKREPKKAKTRTETVESAKADGEERWKKVVSSLPKIIKYFQVDDFEQNAKNIALFCAKLKRKANARPKKTVKEYAARAKRVWKEMQSYWKRRVKETADLLKKREKLEFDRRRRDEEREEQLRQRKKIEFLIQRSSIYAEIMSKKLGPGARPPTESAVLTSAEQARAAAEAQCAVANNERRLREFDKGKETLDFSQVEIEQNSARLQTPATFSGSLKDYQLKGLRWLDSLYLQGINGILADEMGLGKTVQALALLAHLSGGLDNWGPFLVIAPATTLFNWYSECKKFCPNLSALPFWGSKRERQTFRRSLQQKHLGSQKSEFHVVITSYQVAVADERVLQRITWQYIILDEAQAIKNMNSQRWYRLLELRARNKLLLTGTPIQNTMAELWALLHFIMPQLFDSHEQFQEWFSKDIEAHAQNRQKLDRAQLDRLHAVLKPFMLRRVKRDVESEIGKKHEYDVYCDLTTRQRVLYDGLRRKILLSDLFLTKENREKVKNLMNIVMQLRKVCNHPDLFERKIVRAPLCFAANLSENSHTIYSHTLKVHILYQNPYSNPFNVTLPKRLCLSFANGRDKLLNEEKEKLARFAGLCGPQTIFSLNPNQENLFKLVSSVYYVQRNKEAIAANAKSFLPIAERVLPYLRLPTAFIPSKALNEALTSFYVPKVWAMPPSVVRPRAPDRVPPAMGTQSRYNVEHPTFIGLIKDSAKLAHLDRMLSHFCAIGAKTLIFCQMTKMMNLIEEYLQFRRYKYLRMDGSTQLAERRDCVHRFQTSSEVFVFLLSTRAGGLGVTLTAADAVVFFDNDWNPTMDAQAADRAHRIGRRGDVHVYRLITKNTIEERIIRRAKQKNDVQQTVYSGEAFTGNGFNPQDVVGLLMEEGGV